MSALGKIKAYALTCLSPIWSIYFKLQGCEVGHHFACIGRPGINRKRGTRIQIGSHVTLCSSAMANPVAEGGRCRLATVATDAEIIIHDHVGLSSCIICAASKVEIGEGTLIGGGAMILDTDFHLRNADGTWGTNPKAVSKPVAIGKNCFIGARAIILKGVTIGDGAIIGAGAVITKNVDPHTMVAGNPGRKI